MSDTSQALTQVDKLTRSKALHGSESLCNLLRYLAVHTLEHPGAPVKEYQIATELFGRQSDFDPQVDSAVRVQAGRLRTKLAEYYASEGAQDTLIVELPKGSYLLSFHPRSAPGSTSTGQSTRESLNGLANEFVLRRTFLVTLGILSLLLLGAVIGLFTMLSRRNASARVAPDVPPGIRTFWNAFQKSPEEPWVIFSNAAFVGRPDIGLRYYDAKRDSSAVIFDHYTGVGEVLAVHQLDGVFNLLGRKIRVKRGSLFSLDDAKNNDLIFIGSPAENLTLLEIPGSQEFQFQSLSEGPRKGNVAIRNVHPVSGEAAEYLASPSDEPLTEEYAVIALLRGLDPNHSVLILAGTTTIGTQSAVEFVSSEESLQILLARLGVSKAEELKPFEALIHVKVARGVPVGIDLLAVRKSAQ